MVGYFRQPEATSAIRHGDWLDTGDLGYRADGELYITGRHKDLILKAGRNLYPQEMESVLGEVEGVRKGCVAAFGVTDPAQGTERLVVAAETREQSPPLRERIRSEMNRKLVEVLGLPADEIVLLDPGTLPKTSSGKLRRSDTRLAYQQGRLGRRRAPAVVQWLSLGRRWLAGAFEQGAQAIGRAIYSAYAYAVFLIALALCRATMLAIPPGPRCAAVLRFYARVCLRVAGLPVQVVGMENLIPGPLMMVSNHASYLDALVLIAALPRHFSYVAKKELMRVPVLRTFLKKASHLLVDRVVTAQSVAAAGKMEEWLARGDSILAFPEGTFTRARGLRPFRLGAFRAAARAGRPVVPLAIRGSRHVLPDKSWLIRRSPMQVIIRPPIYPAGSDWASIIRLRDAAFAQILDHCGEPRLEIPSAAVPGQP